MPLVLLYRVAQKSKPLPSYSTGISNMGKYMYIYLIKS